MKNALKFILFFAMTLVTVSCVPAGEMMSIEAPVKFSFQAGINAGGVTENTDMSVVPDVHTADAFTGATSLGFHAGFHIHKDLGNNQTETGVDYMYSHQTFTYNDEENGFRGRREITLSQFMFPVTYNIVIFKRRLPEAEIQLKAGYLVQWNFLSATDYGTLPLYSTRQWSNGLIVGLSAFPIRFDNGNKLGFYLEAYRGNRIYEDYYNRPSFDMPGTSFVRLGVKFKF